MKSLGEKFRDLETRDQALVEVGEWVLDTCLLFGVSPDLAFKVASMCVEGLKREWQKDQLGGANEI